MRLITRVGGTALVAAALTAGLAPPAAAAPAEKDRGRGNLIVCVDDLRGRDAEIEVNGRSDRDADTDGGCTFFHRLRAGWYEIDLDAPSGCDDDSEDARVRRNRTTVVVLDADCPRFKDWGDKDWGDKDWGDKDWEDDDD